MAGDDRIAAQVFSLEDMHVRPADTAGHHPHKLLAWCKCRQGQLLHFDKFGLKEECRFHKYLLSQKIVASAALNAGVEAFIFEKFGLPGNWQCLD
jgi:hypothetical protein